MHGLLSNKNILIQRKKKKKWVPPTFPNKLSLGGQKGNCKEGVVVGSEKSDMTFEGRGEMFEGHSSEMCARKFPLMSIGDQAVK